jgi:AcrR family transcriptional regulator
MTPKAVSPRRGRILAAAEREFAAYGYSGSRVERIAATAGVNKQLLFHYFGSKAGLYRAASASTVSRLTVDRPTGTAPGDQVRELIGRLDSAARQNPLLLGSWVGGDADDLAAGWRLHAVQSARRILDSGQRTGHFRDNIDLDAIAELVVMASFGIGAVGRDSEDLNDATRRNRCRDTLARMVIDYCAWR